MNASPSRQAIGRRQLVIATAAVLGAGSLRAQSRIELKLAHSAAEDNPRHLAAQLFAEKVAAGSGGRIQVLVHPASRIADDVAAIDGLMTGRIDLTANSQGPVAGVVPEYACLGLPYVFETQQQVWRVLSGPVGEELRRHSLDKGLRVLGFWDNGFRHVTNSRRPIHSPADIASLKIRTPSDAVTMALMRALGAEPVVVKFSELPQALVEGRVDGQENPLVNIWTAQLHKVQKHLALTNHKVESTPFLMSERSWSRLSPADQNLLKAAAEDATLMQRQSMLKSEERSFSRLTGAGMQVSHIDLAAFRAASKPVIDQWQAGPTGPFAQTLVAAAKGALQR